MTDLVVPTDLIAHLRRELDPASAFSACRVASGWLRSATGLTEWPVPVPDDLWGWALELAVMVYDNPEGMDSSNFGRLGLSWGVEPMKRRAQILAAAKAAYRASSGGALPVGSFPDAAAYPDAAVAGWSSAVVW